MNRFFSDTKYAISWGILGLLALSVLGSVFLLTKTFSEFEKIDNPQGYPNTISVSGEGESVAVPDVVTFTFSVVETSEDVASAQKMATEKTNEVLGYLQESGIEDKDIKTTSYDIYPKYEWIQPVCTSEMNCPRGTNELVGYEVIQTVEVKVRDTEQAGDLLSGVGEYNVSRVGSLNFEVDDEDQLIADARSEAISDAKEKARVLAKELGVKLGDVMGFYESNDGGDHPMYKTEDRLYGMGGDSAQMESAPQLPSGENTFLRRVNITYEIK